MVAIFVTNRAGAHYTINGQAGGSLMEALRDHNMDVEAICGGCCSCATCHVFVDGAWMAKLPPRSEDEQELLQATANWRPDTSRLSCQVPLTDALNGIVVTVAPAE
jgi:2Fe-2S ferredoxin